MTGNIAEEETPEVERSTIDAALELAKAAAQKEGESEQSLLSGLLQVSEVCDAVEGDVGAALLISRALIARGNDEDAIYGGVLTLYVARSDSAQALTLWSELVARSRDLAGEAAYDMEGRLPWLDLLPEERAAVNAYFESVARESL